MDIGLDSYKKVNIDELRYALYNPRKELKKGDKEYEKLKKSIMEFGYIDPVIVNERNMTIIGGHQRVRVMKDLGYSEINCIMVDLDESKERALNVALNKISGDWDLPKLKDLLIEIEKDKIDLEVTGFDDGELQKLIEKFAENVDKKAEYEITEELLEEHNYVVLYFDNSLDWKVACEKLGIKTVHDLSNNSGHTGIGRVIRGKGIIERL
jgi:ParB-like chromosome segregation protein Spo0J